MQCSWQLVPLVSASAAEPALADTINNSKHANGGAIFKYVLSAFFSSFVLDTGKLSPTVEFSRIGTPMSSSLPNDALHGNCRLHWQAAKTCPVTTNGPIYWTSSPWLLHFGCFVRFMNSHTQALTLATVCLWEPFSLDCQMCSRPPG